MKHCKKCGQIMKKSGEHTCPTTSWNKGIPMTDEQKKKLSVWHTGRKLSPEHAKKVTKNFEKKWTERKWPEGKIKKWKNGVYNMIKYNGKIVYLHRHIAEQKLSRKLVKGEEVHHINFNPMDNSPDNLLVIMRKDHLKLHSQLELVMRELMERGIVYFKNGKYRV